ncbi:hypothetical protein COZ73_02250, partial [Candidatus Falkowbacteria bacterium CG_4_8_14_3_um_filter_36_11]
MKNYKVNILVILLIITFISSFLAKKITAENVLAERLAGRILLQVENNGEAWYVNPNDFKRYYLGRPQDAFNLMRDLGLGVKNIDINKIALAKANFNGLDTDKDGLPDNIEISIGTDINNPDSDSDGYTDKEEALNNFNPKGEGKLIIDNKLAKDLAGRILLQVENNGEAWYVNPNDFKRYYLGRPQDAFNLMRDLGLGVKNIDINKIALAKANFNGLDTDKDGLPDNIEISIGTDINNPDSDSDGYTDKEEALNNFNPKGEGKLIIDNKLAKDLAGRILLQVENNGEAWYVNPN